MNKYIFVLCCLVAAKLCLGSSCNEANVASQRDISPKRPVSPVVARPSSPVRTWSPPKRDISPRK